MKKPSSPTLTYSSPLVDRVWRAMIPLVGYACLTGCSGVPSDNCESTTIASPSAANPCGLGGGSSGGTPSAGGTAAAGGQNASYAGTAASSGGVSSADSPVANGSFEWDQQPASTFATAPPGGWTMLSSNSVGNLLHAARSDAENLIPPASEGQNVAYFDSLTGSSYREAQSNCFPVNLSKSISARYQVQVPASQNPSGTRAAVKFWYYQDATCTTASTLRASETQIATSNSAAGVWETHEFKPSLTPPADGVAARISIRGAYTAGPTCGDGGAGCLDDKIYFDEIVVWQ